MTDLPTPTHPAPVDSTGSRGSRILGAIAAGLVAATCFYAFVVTGPDSQLGETVRILYLHVPSVITAYLLVAVAAGASAFHLWKRNEFSDLLAASATEIGMVFLGVTLVTGMLWGRPTWGVYWVWDARLTTTALLFLMLVGYAVVRSLPAEPRSRATRSAVLSLVSLALVPVVSRSVEWWNSLHQGQTVLGTSDAKLDGAQLFGLFLGMVSGPVIAAWLLMHRFRVAWLAERAEELGLDAAIAARRLEAGGDAAGATS